MRDAGRTHSQGFNPAVPLESIYPHETRACAWVFSMDGGWGGSYEVPGERLLVLVGQGLAEVVEDARVGRAAARGVRAAARLGRAALAVDDGLGEHSERRAARRRELGDLLVGAGLLLPELVAGEGEDRQPLRRELRVQRDQVLVVARSRASLARHVNHEADLAFQGGHVYGVAVGVHQALEVVQPRRCAAPLLVVARLGLQRGRGQQQRQREGGAHRALPAMWRWRWKLAERMWSAANGGVDHAARIVRFLRCGGAKTEHIQIQPPAAGGVVDLE